MASTTYRGYYITTSRVQTYDRRSQKQSSYTSFYASPVGAGLIQYGGNYEREGFIRGIGTIKTAKQLIDKAIGD